MNVSFLLLFLLIVIIISIDLHNDDGGVCFVSANINAEEEDEVVVVGKETSKAAATAAAPIETTNDHHRHYYQHFDTNYKCQNILISPLPSSRRNKREGVAYNNNDDDDGIAVSWNVFLNNKNHSHHRQHQNQQPMNSEAMRMMHWGYELPSPLSDAASMISNTSRSSKTSSSSLLLPYKTMASYTVLRNTTIIYNATLHFDGIKSSSNKLYFQVCSQSVIYEATNLLKIECPRLSMFGDLGWSNNQILELTKLESIDSIVLFGDMVYYWYIDEHVQQFFKQLSNMTTTTTTKTINSSSETNSTNNQTSTSTISRIIPLLVTPGNGEAYEGFLDYKSRFFMPSPLGQEVIKFKNQWYSINIGGGTTTTDHSTGTTTTSTTGGIHLIGLSTEVLDYWDESIIGKDGAFHMMEWLRKDLQYATLPQQRKRYPWIVIQYHRPSYSTWGDPIEDPKPYLAFENIFKTYAVDIVFAGHVHNMEITTPIHKNQPQFDTLNMNTTYIENAKAPIHVISGNPSNFESTSFFRNAESWTLWRSYMFGYATLSVGPSTTSTEILTIEIIHSATKQIAHRLTVAKTKTKEQQLIEEKSPKQDAKKTSRRGVHESDTQEYPNIVEIALEVDTSCSRNRRLRELPVGSSVVATDPSPSSPSTMIQDTSDVKKHDHRLHQSTKQRRRLLPPKQQLSALRAIYDTLRGPSWLHQYGWESSLTDADVRTNNISIHPCDWYGVTCDSVVDQMLPNAGESTPFGITAIMMPSNNLKGDIGLLEDAFTVLGTSLQILDLSSNFVYGKLFDLSKVLPYVHTIALSPWSTHVAAIEGKPSLPLNAQYAFMERVKLNGPLPDIGQLQCYAGGSMYDNLGCLLWFINTTNITGPVPESVCLEGKRYNEIYLIGTQVRGGPCLGGVTSYHTQQECNKNISCPTPATSKSRYNHNNEEVEWYHGQKRKRQTLERKESAN